MKKIYKKILSLAMAAVLATGSTVSVFAADTTSAGAGETTAQAEITAVPSVIDVTLPTTLSLRIDPNDRSETTSPGTVTNNSMAPVKINIEKIAAATGNNCKVVAPEEVSHWQLLGTEETNSKIAIGMKCIEDDTITAWAYNQDHPLPFAQLRLASKNSGTCNTARLSLVSKHGLAFNTSTTLKYDITYEIELSSDTETSVVFL
jgi:hypothetical protein